MNIYTSHKRHSFLLIDGSSGYRFSIFFDRILSPYGDLHILNEVEAIKIFDEYIYDLIIIDSTIIKNTSELTRRIRAVHPTVAIIIITASANWSEAREAFRSGATNYIDKAIGTEAFKNEILNTLFSFSNVNSNALEKGVI